MVIHNLSKHYMVDGESLMVLSDFSLEVEQDAITALVGPSGCGKTTLLRLIGGLESIDSGYIELNDQEKGPMSYLFQEPRLLPWDSVLTNVELVLRESIPTKKERIQRAMEFISLVGLEEYASFKPDQLSGGMRQRVAIARAFAFPAKIMLLDEPFQSLDSLLRWSLVQAFITLWEKNKRTVLYITHDVQEAFLMADRVVKLSHRPMRVLKEYPIMMSRSERSLRDPQFAELFSQFYQ
ncbi:MAG: ABC transporter ATP-binding protein [Sphaerochaetaceae bacterium]|jgi:NitT/TauT family transport system ATP-binding protein